MRNLARLRCFSAPIWGVRVDRPILAGAAGTPIRGFGIPVDATKESSYRRAFSTVNLITVSTRLPCVRKGDAHSDVLSTIASGECRFSTICGFLPCRDQPYANRRVPPYSAADGRSFLERAAGIEPATLAWKARALPLCNARDFGQGWIRTSVALSRARFTVWCH
jgi:hypothetical protein